jgi:glycosyltransferase involved in cell wall biosynthesis
MKRKQYQVAVVDVYSGRAFWWAEAVSWMLRKLHKPYVLALHGGNLPIFSATHETRVRKLLLSASAVTAPSRYLLETMKAYRPDILLIPNSIDTRGYEFRCRQEASPRLVWLRAFHDTYHPELAVKTLAILVNQFPDAHLTMIGPDKGDGSLQRTREEAEKLGLINRLTLIGSIPKSEVSANLTSADIFLNTSRADNTPVSVLEAMACGLCVVSTNVGGIRYLLNDQQDSLLVPPDDPQAMASAVWRVLSNPGFSGRLSAQARAKAEGFDWLSVIPLWDRLLRSLAAGARIPIHNACSATSLEKKGSRTDSAQVSSTILHNRLW